MNQLPSKRPPRPYWTPEEDELLRQYGSHVTLKKLAQMLKQQLGTERTPRGIARRRRVIDPAWDAQLGQMISLISVSGLGSEQQAVNPRAIRQAEADGVLRHRLVRGRKVAVVPLAWADAWIAAEEENARRHDELRDAGWLYTPEIAKMLGISNAYCIVALKNLKMRNGAWRMFRNVESVKLIGKPLLWEPNGIRAAIAAYQRNQATQPRKRKIEE